VKASLGKHQRPSKRNTQNCFVT